LPWINYQRPDISCPGFTELIRLYPKLGSFQRKILFGRHSTFPQSERFVYDSILVWKAQVLELIVQMLNSWINFEKFGRTLILIYCGIVNVLKESDSELQ
jgi:hypothetical protein